MQIPRKLLHRQTMNTFSTGFPCAPAGRVVFITGATSGIGEATARFARAAGWSVVITGRRQDRVKQLAAELESEGLVFDVRDRKATAASIASVPDEWVPNVLVNNAGLAVGLGPVDQGDYEDWDRMMDTNVSGLLNVSREWLPRMQRGARVINVGSVAGKQAYPGGAVYNASKFAVDGLTQAMRMDLLPRGIQVGQVSPGAVETEFSKVRFKGDEEAAARVYDGFEPLRAEDVADAIWYMATRPPHVCIHDVWIMPSAQASAYHLQRMGQ